MFTALVPTLYKVIRGVVPFFDYDQLVTCEYDALTDCNYDSLYIDSNIISSTFYER